MAIGLGQRLLAIDWDRHDLRLVLVRPKGDGIELVKAVSVPIPNEINMDDAESFGAFLGEAIRQAKLGAKRAMLSIPRDKCVLNTLNLPPTPGEELASLIQFQIVKELPFAAEQATLDFAVSGAHDPKAACDVVVAAVRETELSFFKQVASEAGLTLDRIGLRPHANVTAVMTNRPDLSKQTLLVVEVGPRLTEIDIVRGGVLVFSRSASYTVPTIAAESAESIQDSRIISSAIQEQATDESTKKAVGGLMVEVIRSFEAFRATEAAIKIEQVVVCGSTGLETQLAESLAARFASRAELYAPNRALNLSPQRAKELRGFSAPLGLALGNANRGLATFDFLHPKKPISRRALRLKKAPIAAVTALLFVGSAVMGYVRFVAPKVAEVETLRKKVNAEKKQSDNVRDFKTLVDAMEEWQESEQYFPDVLLAMTEVFPPDDSAFATRVDLSMRTIKNSAKRDCTLRMSLRTATLGKGNEVADRLREVGCDEVRTGRETHRPGGKGEEIYQHDTSIEALLPARKDPPKATNEDALEPASPLDAVGDQDGSISSPTDRADPETLPVNAPAEGPAVDAPDTGSVPARSLPGEAPSAPGKDEAPVGNGATRDSGTKAAGTTATNNAEAAGADSDEAAGPEGSR